MAIRMRDHREPGRKEGGAACADTRVGDPGGDLSRTVGLPVFLYANGWRFIEVGGFLAAWTSATGVQAFAPSLVSRSEDGLS